jgi:hypothetical protein
MPDGRDPLADRIQKLAEARAAAKNAEASVTSTQAEAQKFLYENARPQYEHVLKILQDRIQTVNPQIQAVPQYVYSTGQHCVVQGNVAAYLLYSQLILNAGPINLRISFGAQPRAFYIDRSSAPRPEHYTLEPAVEKEVAFKIVWMGDLGKLTSEQLAEFVLQHLTEYFLDHQR